MNTKRTKFLMAVALIGSVSFAAVGCAPQPAAQSKPAPSSPAKEFVPEPVEPSRYGDVMTRLDENGQPEIAENEHGQYERVTIDPLDDSMTVFTAIDDAVLAEHGFTHDQGVAAQKFAATWIVEELIDGPGLDSQAEYDRWVAEEADKYLVPKHRDDILSNGGEGNTLLVAAPKDVSGPFIADGGARVTAATVTVDSVYGYNTDGEAYLAVEGTTTFSLRLSDETLIANTLIASPDVTTEQIIAQHPGLGDGKENTVSRNVTFAYGLSPQADGSFQFSGYTVNFDAEVPNF